MNTTRISSPARRVVLALFLGLACGGAALAAEGPKVEASGAWIRWLPSGLPAGGYLTLHNSGDARAEVVGASSPDYGSVMLHESVREGDRMDMRMVDRIAVPAHGSVALQPGGYHLMLMQPTRDVRPGDRVPITLRYAGGETQKVEFEVRGADAGGPSAAPGMEMKGMDMKGMSGGGAGH